MSASRASIPPRSLASRPRASSALLRNPGIVRNRLKVASAVANAKATLAVQAEFGSLDAFLWSFVGGRPKVNRWRSPEQVPAQTPESEAMSRALSKRGFKFVGPTICYAFMQAVGMVDDHAARLLPLETQPIPRQDRSTLYDAHRRRGDVDCDERERGAQGFALLRKAD